MSLQPGDAAPDFTLPATIGDKVSLSDYRGKKNVLLLFYPLDFSPVCSVETVQPRLISRMGLLKPRANSIP